MSDYIFITLLFASLLLVTSFMVIYFSTYISNCNNIPENEMISSAECCQGTWENFWSSVPITLSIIVIFTILFFLILYFGTK